MLDRCLSFLRYEDSEESGATFYLADSKWVPIWSSDTIDIGENEVPWTLINYITYSNTKYPCKAKIYCVKKGKQ